MSSFRPRPSSTPRPSAIRRLSSLYTPLPISEDDASDYPLPESSDPNDTDDAHDTYIPHRPSHTRQTSRTALLSRASMASIRTLPRSIRSLAQADAFTNPVQLESIAPKTATPDETRYQNADGEALDAQQRKMALVSQALEDTGMGRYQWCIFVLCGFGYALDLAWAQAFGLIMPRVQTELGIPNERYGDIFAVFSFGLTCGAFFWGIAVDVIGRKWAFNLTVGITALFGSLLGVMDSYRAIVGLTMGVGFGLGGNIPIDATITLEFLPQGKRYLLVALSAFQPLGVILTSLICWRLIPAYSCADGLGACSGSTSLTAALEDGAEACCTKASNYGWRYSLFSLGALSVLAFTARFVLFTFRESPRFLITQGRDAEAVSVCANIARTNGKTPTLTLPMLEAIDAEDSQRPAAGGTRHAEFVAQKLKGGVSAGHLKRLFSSRKMTTLTLLAWAVYMADHWGFTIAGSFLPKILAERGADQGVGIDVTYRNYIVVSMAGAPGVLLGAVLVEIPQLGRKWAMVGSSAMMAASLLLYTTVTTFEGSVRLNAMEYFFQSTFNAILYGWTPEAFPAEVRGSASGLASFWGRLTSIVAPLIAQNAGTYGQLYLAGGGVCLCTVLACFLPDTRRVDVL